MSLMEKKEREEFYFLTTRQRNILFKNGIESLTDLLYRFPLRYENRGEIKSLLNLKDGEFVTVKGKVIGAKGRRSFKKRNFNLFESLITDSYGNLHLVWFNQPWVEQKIEIGKSYYFFGRVSIFSTKGGVRLQMENPEFEEFSSSEHLKIVPVYKRIGILSSKSIREIVLKALKEEIDEFLPEEILKREGFKNLKESFLEVHFPEDEKSLNEISSRESIAIKRFVFQELFAFEMMMLNENISRKREKAKPIRKNPDIGNILRKILPFELTKSQRRVFREVVEDCSSDSPMYRLLQGDVGSGKTIIAFLTMIWCALDGYQSAFMAPTETLAKQVYERLKEIASKSGLEVAFLISSTKQSEKREILKKIKEGGIKLIVGTHALIQEKVEYSNLNFVVIDEQHRFGVLQRDALFKKGDNPHLLLMSATPIPRSIALTVFGDLDISILDEMPPNRAKVITAIRGEYSRQKVEIFLKREMDLKKQVLVVFPLIEESDSLDCDAAVSAYERFKKGIFKNYRIGLIHGRMSNSEKDEVMEKMRKKELDLLVATTVIEVGIDLPDATVIVIENAERFGLAQLHQLRGRVGRGGEKGYCILMVSKETSKSAENRLRILTETDDGFKVAEEDLKLRGIGEVFGTSQWGEGEFHFANPLKDMKMLESARMWARKILKKEVKLKKEEEEKLRDFLKEYSQKKIRFLRAG
jgi:ATP-dependent DNA helicase RecG